MRQDMLRMFGRQEDGAVALEYVLLVAGIGIVLVAAIFLFGEDLAGYWNSLNDSITMTPS